MRIAVSLWAVMQCLVGWTGNELPEPPTRELSVKQLEEDFRILVNTFQKAHPGFYRHTSPETMQSRILAIRAQLDRPMSDIAFFRKLLPFIGGVECGHTNARPPKTFRGFLLEKAKIFPFDLQFIDQRAFVGKNLSGDETIPKGSEILKINGDPLETIVKRLLPGFGTDGYNQTSKYAMLTDLFWLHYFERYRHSQTFKVVFKPYPDGKLQTVSLKGISAEKIIQYRRERRNPETFDFKVLPGKDTAILTIRHFLDPTTPAFLKETFAEIAKLNLGNLIIDIRNNGGGEDLYNAELFNYLMARPYRFYRSRQSVAKNFSDLAHVSYKLDNFFSYENLATDRKDTLKKQLSLGELLARENANYPVFGIQKPYPNAFKGDVYLLFNGGSISSGGEIPALMHHLGRGTLIGEEPNGAYDGVTAGILTELTLPHSKIRIGLPLIAYFNAVLPGIYPHRGVQPHFPVQPAVADMVAGKDTVLQFTLDLIEARMSP